METWLDENDRPFGLSPEESTTWHELRITREKGVIGPNWHYRVVSGKTTFQVNVFNPNRGVHIIRIRGRWRGPTGRGKYVVENLDVASPEEALIQALGRVQQLVQEESDAP